MFFVLLFCYHNQPNKPINSLIKFSISFIYKTIYIGYKIYTKMSSLYDHVDKIKYISQNKFHYILSRISIFEVGNFKNTL